MVGTSASESAKRLRTEVMATINERTAAATTTDTSEVPAQELAVDISREYAGCVFAIKQSVRSNAMTSDAGTSMIRMLYEFDRGECMSVSQFVAANTHPKLEAYCARVKDNMAACDRRHNALHEAQLELLNGTISDKEQANKFVCKKLNVDKLDEVESGLLDSMVDTALSQAADKLKHAASDVDSAIDNIKMVASTTACDATEAVVDASEDACEAVVDASEDACEAVVDASEDACEAVVDASEDACEAVEICRGIIADVGLRCNNSDEEQTSDCSSKSDSSSDRSTSSSSDSSSDAEPADSRAAELTSSTYKTVTKWFKS